MKRNLWNMTAATLGALALSMNGIRPAGAAETAFTAAGTVPAVNFTTAVAGLTGRYMALESTTISGKQALQKTLTKLNLGDWQLVATGNRPLLALNISNKTYPRAVSSSGSGNTDSDNYIYTLSLGSGTTDLTAFDIESTGDGATSTTAQEVPQANLADTQLTATIKAASSGAIDMYEGDYSMSINFNVTAQ